MTKIIKAKFKVSRRLRSSIWDNPKDPYAKRNYGPGQHGAAKNIKSSDYGAHLKAKQRLRAHYGRINEKQFRNLFDTAHKMKGNSGVNFVALLESRLDAIVYRLNLAPTIFAARQLVSHKHIKVNGKTVNIASYRAKVNDVIEIKEASRQVPIILEGVAKVRRTVPDYLKLEADAFRGTLVKLPEDISSVPYPFEADLNLIIELYSR
jgi:small subunit ribosomal protein S4